MNNLIGILLKKQLNNKNTDGESSWLPKNHTHWITLGHFDDMFIYELDPKKGFLKNIQEDKRKIYQTSNEYTYFHSLYLIPDNDTYDLNFNNNENWFIAIVRIHFPKSLNLTGQFDELRQRISKKLTSFKLSHQIYYATEFSDMVLDVRSKNFSYLLEVILNIRRDNKIELGKMYTYFGINENFLRNPNLITTDSDKIPMFSMRFSGYNMDTVKKQVTLVKKYFERKPDLEYGINGIDDILLIYQELETKKLIRLYREWLFNDSFLDYRKSESTTRVGVEICTEKAEFHTFIPDRDLIDSTICNEIPSLCNRISEYIASYKSQDAYLIDPVFDFGWFHSIEEVAHSLVRMSRTPIMDEIVYLIAPGIRAFLINIINNIGTAPRNKDYYTFAESCSYFIEQLTRIEGQLSYHPEIRPVIYDIPVFMLEYTIAFLNKVSSLLKTSDGDKKNLNTVFMLVPRPCELTSAVEIFSATKEIPGLVHLTIPENTLYNPKRIFMELCHEISHYVGEKFRMRELRKNAYASAAGALAARSFYCSNKFDLISMFKQKFLSELQHLIGESTISDMHEIVQTKIAQMFNTKDGMSQFIRDYYKLTSTKKHFSTPIEILSDDQIRVGYNDFYRYLSDLDVLFREIFADVCMLSILDVDHYEYLKILLSELAKNIDSDTINIEAFAIRILVCSKTMNREIKYNQNIHMDIWNEVNEIIIKYQNELEHKVPAGKYNFYIPSNSVSALLQYAQECYTTIQNSITNDQKESVMKMYRCLSNDNFHFRDILYEIEECRKAMINEDISSSNKSN